MANPNPNQLLRLGAREGLDRHARLGIGLGLGLELGLGLGLPDMPGCPSLSPCGVCCCRQSTRVLVENPSGWPGGATPTWLGLGLALGLGLGLELALGLGLGLGLRCHTDLDRGGLRLRTRARAPTITTTAAAAAARRGGCREGLRDLAA